MLLSQFNSPIILLLIFAAGLSFYLHQVASASIILVIVFISGLLGFWQEKGAADAVAGLLAIIQINLAHGARKMATHKVIVKRLASIENFGSMNVLCTDKTGTLTEGTVKMHSVLDLDGKESEEVFLLAYVNASFETGFGNPIDQAILRYRSPDISGFKKLDEVPYDFVRKRLSILASFGSENTIVTKGALVKCHFLNLNPHVGTFFKSSGVKGKALHISGLML